MARQLKVSLNSSWSNNGKPAAPRGQPGSYMNGLRVYIKIGSRELANGDNVFYSRRGDGPFYCWRYEAAISYWRVERMHASDIAARELSVASWKSVPEQLQARLGEHYQD